MAMSDFGYTSQTRHEDDIITLLRISFVILSKFRKVVNLTPDIKLP